MSGAPRYVSLLGLGFGDCGKGRFVDALCATWGAHTVVRFNGGAQAGHNVVLPDGRHHTFSQFGAGTFHHGVATVLASPVVVHPTALLVEGEVLRRKGVADAMARLWIDARCRVTTPFHQAAGRLREWARGAQAHGSCGVGVGETVRHALEASEESVRYGDLLQPSRVLEKLEAARLSLRREFDGVNAAHAEASAELAMLDDPTLATRWLAAVAPLLRLSPPASTDQIGERLALPGTVLFEGAQGVLLDEWRGFHPHTTWSTISTSAVEAVLRDAGIAARVEHLGVFRRGHPDAVLLRYALQAVGPLDGLVASHIDAVATAGLRWCESYQLADGSTLSSLPWAESPDLAHQHALTTLLHGVRPAYAAAAIASAEDWIAHVEALSGLPVRHRAFGPSRHQTTTH